jgi:hypothetical protein
VQDSPAKRVYSSAAVGGVECAKKYVPTGIQDEGLAVSLNLTPVVDKIGAILPQESSVKGATTGCQELTGRAWSCFSSLS